MRKALGASRMRLICQLLTECLLLSVAGALLAILFARWGTSLLVRYISTSNNAIFLELSPDGRVLAFTATVALLTAILFGLLPALQSTRVPLTSAMKGRQALEIERPSRFPSRKWIVASQLALSLVLLVAAGLLLGSFAKLAAHNRGSHSRILAEVALVSSCMSSCFCVGTFLLAFHKARCESG